LFERIEGVVFVLSEEVKAVSGTGRIPLWIVATIAGLGVIAVLGLFFYGAYAGLGSAS
jgi:photosystem II PsbJ protein